MVRDIIKLSKEEFLNPLNILRTKSELVTDFSNVFQNEVRDLIDSFEPIPAVGLAAPQIGIFKRFVIVNLNRKDGNKDHLILVNPKLNSENLLSDVYKENCMSLLGWQGNVLRKTEISITYQDRFGKLKELKASDFLARVILHEMDHLEGILYVDRMQQGEELEIHVRKQN